MPTGSWQRTYRDTPLGREYLKWKEKSGGGRGRDALDAEIFNHLHGFFSRYYQDGDFISKRRYSKNQRYAIPYNGEEVYLHWANSDQYYVQDRRVLPRLFVCSARHLRALQTPGGRCRKGQRQG